MDGDQVLKLKGASLHIPSALPATVVVGLQWGDEGKGKIIDFVSEGFDAVARFNGGSNAGHTVVVGGTKLSFHLLPSGVMRNKRLFIGNGVVVDPEVLLKELDDLASLNIRPDLLISDRAHLTLGPHKFRDRFEEGRRGAFSIGTTLRGISPAFSDRASRVGVRAGDLLEDEALKMAYEAFAGWNRVLINEVYGEDGDAIVKDSFAELKEVAPRLRPYVGDVSAEANDLLSKGGKLLLEGAQGYFLDIDYGTYPYVTATHTTASYAPAGIGIPSQGVQRVIGIIKAYCTRVGAGPFVSEISGPLCEAIRKKGGEYGATTGRPRRVGWFDAVAVRSAANSSGVTELAVTKVDVLGGLEKVPVCDGYMDAGRVVARPPSTIVQLRRCRPHYLEVPGWPDLSPEEWRDKAKGGIGSLPEDLRSYLKMIESSIGLPIRYVSYGYDRADTLELGKDVS
jgi:adenylosuccinate synthase